MTYQGLEDCLCIAFYSYGIECLKPFLWMNHGTVIQDGDAMMSEADAIASERRLEHVVRTMTGYNNFTRVYDNSPEWTAEDV